LRRGHLIHNLYLLIHSPQLLAATDDSNLKEKGGYLTPGQSRWSLGTLLLTTKKLTFFTSKSRFVWETPLSSIKELRIEKRVYGVSQSDTICVVYESFDKLLKSMDYIP